MLRYETLLSVRKNLGEMLNYVQYRQDSILITRSGKATAAIVDINLFNKINTMSEKFQTLNSQLQNQMSGHTEEEITNIIDEAVMHVCHNTK